MKLKNITESIKGFVSSTSWKIEKHAPEILLVAGVVSTVAAVVMAVKATPKAVAVIEEHKAQLEVIEKSEEAGKTVNEDGETVEYSHEDAKKDRRTTLGKTIIKCGKLYALSAFLLGMSIFCQIKGYKTLSRRLAEASMA